MKMKAKLNKKKKNSLIKNLSRERKEKKRTGERAMGKGERARYKINREKRRGRNPQAEPMRERLKDKE